MARRAQKLIPSAEGRGVGFYVYDSSGRRTIAGSDCENRQCDYAENLAGRAASGNEHGIGDGGHLSATPMGV